MLLTLLQDFAKDSVPLLLSEDALKLGTHENQQLKNFDRVLADVQVVDLHQVHYNLKTIQLQKLVEKEV